MGPESAVQSHSRLSKFEQCPQLYKLHYIDRQRPEPGVPLRFGSAVHDVLERLLREHVAEERIAPLNPAKARALWADAWQERELSGLLLYDEGLDILVGYARSEGVVDWRDEVGIEVGFEIGIGEIRVCGFIDRVRRLDDHTVEIRDYKTNRLMPNREELEHHLQLGIYNLAARELYPWADTVVLTLDMLRHETRLATTRTDEQLDAVRDYVVTLAAQLEAESAYEAKLNPNCQYCEHRGNCLEYQKALAGNAEVIRALDSDLEGVAKEREQMATLEKLYKGRKGELDKLLKAKLDQTESLELGGRLYRIGKTTRRKYPVGETVDAIAKASGRKHELITDKLVGVDNGALTRLLSGLKAEVASPELRMLKSELDALATHSHSTRIFSTAVKGGAR